MTSPIDTAYVDIQPDVSTFARDAERDIDRAVDAIGREFDRLADRIEVSFTTLGDRMESVFDDLADASDRNFDLIARDADGAGRQIADDIERGSESAERSLDELGRHAAREFDKVSREADKTKSSLTSKLGGIGGIAAAGIAGTAAALTAGLGAIATFGLESAGQMEQQRIQFQSLIGTVEGGNKVFADLQKFAAVTPFEFPDVARASARFLAFNQAVGLTDGDLQDFLTTVGNVASVTGGGAEALNSVTTAMGQIASSGKLTLDNLNQISEALPGFSGVAAIASATGKTTAQVMDEISKGTINADDGIAALLKGMQKFPGAAGAMEKQSQTLVGVFSTFKDTIGQALAGAFEPVIPEIKASLTQLTPILGDALKGFAPQLGKALVALAPLLTALIKGLTPILSVVTSVITSLGGLGPAFSAIGKIVEALLKPFTPLIDVVVKVVNVLAEALVPVAEQLAPIIGDLIGPVGDLIIALLPIIPPLGQIIALLIKIAAPLLQFEAFIISILASKAIAPLIELIASGLEKLIGPLSSVAEWVNNIDWGNVWDGIVHGLSVAWHAIEDFFVGIGHWFADLPGKIGDWLSSLPHLIADFFQSAFDNLLHVIGMGIGLVIYEFLHFPQQIIDAVKSLGGLLGDFFSGLWHKIVGLVVAGVTNVVSFVSSLPGKVVAGVQALPGLISGIFRRMMDGARNLVSSGFNWIVQQITSIPGRIVGLASKFLSAGKSLISGFINGFKNVGGFIGDIAGSIVSKIKGFLNNVIGKLNGGIADIDKYLPGDLPRIPYLASGGIAYGPALIGEKPGGRGEAAIPLDDPRALSALRDALGGGGGGGVVFEQGAITVVFNGVVPTAAEARRTGEEIANGIGQTLAGNTTRTSVRSI